MEWHVTNDSKLIRPHQHRFISREHKALSSLVQLVIHVRHLLHTLLFFFFFSKNRLSKILFSNPFPKIRSDCESQKSGFGFNPKNPPWVWILWIPDPFLDLSKENAKSAFGFGNPDLDFQKKPKKPHPKSLVVAAEKIPLKVPNHRFETWSLHVFDSWLNSCVDYFTKR